MTINILKEKPQMSSYCRERHTVNYFECKPFVEDDDFPEVFWQLRKLPYKEWQTVSGEDFMEKYEQCSPYEAISSVSK